MIASIPVGTMHAFFAKAQNAVSWQTHIVSAQTQRWMWDRLQREEHRAFLQKSCVFDNVLPPFVDPSDAILTAPGIVPSSLFTPVFVKPSREYLYHVRAPVLMEPRWGYIMLPPCSVIDESVQYSEMIRSRASIAFFSGLPSFVDLRRKGRQLPLRRERCIISLRFPYGPNYYHFLYDILSRLALLSDYPIPEGAAIVLDSHLRNQSYATEILAAPHLKKLNIIFQDNFFIEADEALIVRSSGGLGNHAAAVNKLLRASPADPQGDKRIFIERKAADGRAILNMEAILPVLKQFQIESVDLSRLSVAEQVDLFRQCRLVVATHGAGLSNIMFRQGAPLSVVEIFQPHSTPLYYYILCKTLGYQHSYVVGERASDKSTRASFFLDPEKLSRQLASVAI